MNRLPLEKQQQAKSVGTPNKLSPMPTYNVDNQEIVSRNFPTMIRGEVKFRTF